MMGAACGAVTPAALAALRDYGAAIGLAFQVVDDILDVTADSQTLGKTAGKDAAADKPTYVSLLGPGRRAYAGETVARRRRSRRWSAAACPTPRACARWPHGRRPRQLNS
jgi:geranylgeranyl pyrophosphate synthase